MTTPGDQSITWDDDRLWAIGRVARFLDVSPETVRAWEDRGLGEAEITANGNRRYRESNVIAFANDLAVLDEAGWPKRRRP